LIRVQKWTSKMQSYDFEVIYKNGRNNIVADALSRQHVDTPHVYAIYAPLSTWIVLE
jgi:hypothetical protein